MSKNAKSQTSNTTKVVRRGRPLVMILSGVALMLIRWSIFASRQVLAEATTLSNSSSTRRFNRNNIEQWLKTEFSSLTTLLSKSRDA